MKLDKYLKEMCINRNEFSKKLGVTYQTLSNAMKGVCDIHLSTAVRIEEVTEGRVTCRDLVNLNSIKILEFKSQIMQMEKVK